MINYFFDLLETGSPSSLSWPGTQYVDQAGLDLRNPPASASQSRDQKHVPPHLGHFLKIIIFLFKYLKEEKENKHLEKLLTCSLSFMFPSQSANVHASHNYKNKFTIHV